MFNLYDSTVLVFSSIFLLVVSQYWLNLHLIFCLLSFLSFVTFMYLPESPKFLV